MGIGHESPWLKKSIAGLLGLVSISIVVQGIEIASHPNADDMRFGAMLIIIGLLIAFAAWRLWPAPTSEKILNSNGQEPPFPSTETSRADKSRNTTQSLFKKRLENGDRLITRALASLLIPVLTCVSIYLSTLTNLFTPMAITPLGAGVCLYAAKHFNRDDITRGITFSSGLLDETRSSYALCLANTIMQPTIIAFYSSFMFWIAIDGDWWGNPGAVVLAIMIGLSPAVVRLCYHSSPIPNGRRMNLWGAILYFPLCYLAVFIPLMTFDGQW